MLHHGNNAGSTSELIYALVPGVRATVGNTLDVMTTKGYVIWQIANSPVHLLPHDPEFDA